MYEDSTKVTHSLLYLKYLNDLKKGNKHMSAWESISPDTHCQPDPQHLEQAATWVNEAVSKTQEVWSNERIHMTSIVDALKVLKDRMLRNSVDLANMVDH